MLTLKCISAMDQAAGAGNSLISVVTCSQLSSPTSEEAAIGFETLNLRL